MYDGIILCVYSSCENPETCGRLFGAMKLKSCSGAHLGSSLDVGHRVATAEDKGVIKNEQNNTGKVMCVFFSKPGSGKRFRFHRAGTSNKFD